MADYKIFIKNEVHLKLVLDTLYTLDYEGLCFSGYYYSLKGVLSDDIYLTTSDKRIGWCGTKEIVAIEREITEITLEELQDKYSSKSSLLLGKAISIASQAFEGVFDKGNNPYILHCLHVMNNVKSDDTRVKIAAVLHDLLEDTGWELQDLKEEGFTDYTLHLLNLVTHKEEDSYEEYINIICTNKDAILIKMADIEHNSDFTRLKGVREKDEKRLIKYAKAYDKLKETLVKLEK